MGDHNNATDSGSTPLRHEGHAGRSTQDSVRALVLIALAAASISLCTEYVLATTPPGPKSFSYLQTTINSGTSVSISGITGQLTLTPWSRPGTMINGTIAAAGSGASPSQVTIQIQLYSGTISFQPVLPNPDVSEGRTYTINLNLYFPMGLNFSTISLASTTGNITARGVTSSSMTIQTSAGSIDLRDSSSSTLQLTSLTGKINAQNVTSRNFSARTTSSFIQVNLATVEQPGTYFGSSNGGTVNFVVPPGSAFTLTASSLLGHAGYYSGFSDCKTNYTSTNVGDQVFNSTFKAICGNGTATISLSSATGDATITR